MESMLSFYCEVLGFHVRNRDEIDGNGIAFISQDPEEHHQIVLLEGIPSGEPQLHFADHLAFRVDGLDAVRAVRDRLVAAGVERIASVTHGNAWSVYFTDPEGNGIECFTDSPFHVAQPYLEPFDLDAPNDEIVATTRAEIEDQPEFQPMADYQAAFEAKLTSDGR